MREATALGAAFAAGFAVNVWNDLGELEKINREGRTVFRASISQEERDNMFKRWERAVKMAQGWAASVD